MEYVRIQSIDDPLFAQMHKLMEETFPPEEVLEFSQWEAPLKDENTFVYVAVQRLEVVGATEYRYYPALNIAMTDFTIIGQEGLGIGPFLWQHRMGHLRHLAENSCQNLTGMFAEIYNPDKAQDLNFGNNPAMHPYVRKEVLAHLGYLKLDIDYVHPSWKNDGQGVRGLDLCFLPMTNISELPAHLIADFLEDYYSVLSNKPQEWDEMISEIRARAHVPFLPL